MTEMHMPPLIDHKMDLMVKAGIRVHDTRNTETKMQN